MRFLAITLVPHTPDPVTGVRKSTGARFREVIDDALPAEVGRAAAAPTPAYGPTPAPASTDR
ncbi:hypothetical protein [Streptomyces sp. IBSBF 3136]|uniref:hypothetical protein n=1 Tax=Streptomyces sp. IBSBF 3136 TaxID=2903524 RepID=UPI003FA69CAD